MLRFISDTTRSVPDLTERSHARATLSLPDTPQWAWVHARRSLLTISTGSSPCPGTQGSGGHRDPSSRSFWLLRTWRSSPGRRAVALSLSVPTAVVPRPPSFSDMHSPTTPRSLSTSKLFAGAWRPWSIPSDWLSTRRTLCGLLNKVTPRNLSRIADRFAALAIRLERSGDAASAEACAHILVHRCIADPTRIGLYASLVQRAADGVEGESLRWRSVDPYHLDDPATSLSAEVGAVLLASLDSAVRRGYEGERDARTLAGFAGELLVLGILSSEDVQDVVASLFEGVSENSEMHCVMLCAILRPIVSSTEATHLIGSLSLVVQIEGVLKEDMITLKTRYMMMVSPVRPHMKITELRSRLLQSMLDHCMYPRPRDAFGSDMRRSEIYGLHDDGAEDGPRPAIIHSTQLVNGDNVHHSDATIESCRRYAETFLTIRDIASAEKFFNTLQPRDWHLFTEALVSTAIGSGDEADAIAVASFLALPSVHRVYADDSAAFKKVLEAEIVMLEDTVLDCPSAYRAMASLLHAAGLPVHLVEDLASRIIVRTNPARDRLLEEFNALNVGADDALEQAEDGAEYTSGEEGSASSYAYAY